MEYKGKAMKDDIENIGCCEMGYPSGYYNIGMKKNGYKKMMAKKAKKMDEYHDMDGHKMKGKKHHGPDGYWEIMPAE